jgi:hypothetical protein
MATEEEEGFTFVDKRRTQSAEVPERVADAPPVVSEETGETEDWGGEEIGAEGGDEAGLAPDVYGVIGYCISLLATEAWHKLGLLADPRTGEAIADLGQAKAAVDAVGDLAARLEAAPTESVPESLRRDLRTLLNDLRLNYVSQRDSAASRNE